MAHGLPAGWPLILGRHPPLISSNPTSRAWRNGRRAGFRSRWGNPWGFESPRSHTPLTCAFAILTGANRLASTPQTGEDGDR